MQFAVLTCFAFVALIAALPRATAGKFSHNKASFLLNGETYQIRGGQMDPQRIPRAYWSNRLALARGMGLNTIFSYLFWDDLEPRQGQFDFSGENNVTEFYKELQDAGLHAVLRVGPYVDGEHEWGGLPAWLSEVPGMAVRQNNGPYLDAAKSYIDALANELNSSRSFISQGGPILMVQIENEYGFCGSDHTYTDALKDIFTAAFDVMFYTNDGGSASALEAGAIPGVLAEIDGSPQTGFAARDEYLNASNRGPNLDGEYYTTWLDTWGPNSTHNHDTTNPAEVGGHIALVSSVQSDINFVLSNQSSFSLYMFHGGTNWGYQNGGDGGGGSPLTADTTSYDYGAPLDESGHVTPLYHGIRQTIFSYLNESLPPIPEQNALIDVPSFTLTPSVAMFDDLPAPVHMKHPVNMEALQQSYGFILYRTNLKTAVSGSIQPGDYPRDRVLVYVNGERAGVMDYSYGNNSVVTLKLKKHDVLDLLVENMGRICFGCPTIFDQRKGIVGNVTVGGTVLMDWEIYSLPLNEPPSSGSSHSSVSTDTSSPPIFYKASFSLSSVGDTFFELPEWIKGIVWVNGVNLGRYWIVGPQQSLYLPGCYMRSGANDVTVLALEPNGANTARGVRNRTWGNHPDPDAP